MKYSSHASIDGVYKKYHYFMQIIIKNYSRIPFEKSLFSDEIFFLAETELIQPNARTAMKSLNRMLCNTSYVEEKL